MSLQPTVALSSASRMPRSIAVQHNTFEWTLCWGSTRASQIPLYDLRVRTAAEWCQSGDVSVNQAAKIAGVSLAEWLEIARERNLTVQLTSADLEADVEAASEL